MRFVQAMLTQGDVMKLGYACTLNLNEDTKIRSCIARNITELRLMELIDHNLEALMNILTYNYNHGILMFRISSDLIPFGSSPLNTLDWQQLFQPAFAQLHELIMQHGLRVSMHPGQYTVLNSPREEVVEKAICDLQYHCDVLDALNLDASFKMVLHIGGVYGDKEAAMKRFVQVYEQLEERIKNRLILENDDRYYTLEDVLNIANQIHAPVVFDNLHHILNTSLPELNIWQCLALVKKTWQKSDGRMKMHYSEQDVLRRPGAHAQSIHVDDFLRFCSGLQSDAVDVMLEVKDKHLSVLRILDQMRKIYPDLLEE